MVRPRLRLLAALAASASLAMMAASPVAAHVIVHAGSYSLAIGWKTEPAYVGEINAVQVIVTDAHGKPVTDLGANDLKVVVSTNSQQSGTLTFNSGFDPDTGLGTPGDYEAPLIPTSPGAYTFHLTGTVHGQAIDVTETSSDQTFDSVQDPSAIQFPTKLPSLTEIVTRLDRMDARIAAAQASGSPSPGSADQASAAATDAHAAADRALLIGGALGAAGLVVGLAALAVALRVRRPG